MRTIALLAFALLAAGCMTSRQVIRVNSYPPGAAIRVNCDGESRPSGRTPGVIVLSRRAEECSVTLDRPGYQPVTLAFERFGGPVNPDALKSGLLIGGLGAAGAAMSGATPQQRVETLGIGVLLAGAFLISDEVTGARNHFEPYLVNVTLDRKQ